MLLIIIALHCKSVFYETSKKRFRRSDKASKYVQMLKKRIFSSTKPLKALLLYPREEPFANKTFFLAMEL